jgi:thioredoxin 1
MDILINFEQFPPKNGDVIMAVTKLTSETFDAIVKESKKPIIIDFYADWCGPCKMISPLLDQISEESDVVDICKINIDDHPDVATQFEVMTIPTLISFVDGKEYKRIIGVQTKDNILALVD